MCLLQVLARPAYPYGFSRMQRVTVVDAADVLCLHAQRTCGARNLRHHTEDSQGFSTAADRMAAVTVVPNILLIPSVYTAQTSARKLSCILRLQLNFRAMQSRSESRHLDRIACDCVLYLSMI